MGACSASFVRRGGCAAAAACSRRTTAPIATAIDDYAKGEPAGQGRRRGFSPARGCFCVAHLRPSRRKVEAATGRRRDYAYWAFAFDEVARPTRERERERLLPGYTRTDLKAISQLTRTVVPYRRRRPAYNERPTTPRHRAACGVFASLLAHFLPSRTEKPFTPR